VDLRSLVERAGRSAPVPPGIRLLAQPRAEAAREILDGERAAIADAHRLFAEDRAAGRAAIGRVAERVLAAMRARVVERTAPTSVAGVAARLDALLPTDEGEHIDDPAFPEERRTRSIELLDAFNRGLASYERFADALEPLLDGEATVLDLASGHGGFALALAERARARGRSLRVIASDLREEYVAIGRRRAAASGTPVEFCVADAFRLDESFACGEVDVITCTQSLHHFGAALVAQLVAESLAVARRGILFVDGARSVALLGLLAVVASATGNRAFAHDAKVSIRKAFVPEELAAIAACAPGGDRLRAFYLPPGFAVLRSL
jgi:SAM-dependent methyltransferase